MSIPNLNIDISFYKDPSEILTNLSSEFKSLDSAIQNKCIAYDPNTKQFHLSEGTHFHWLNGMKRIAMSYTRWFSNKSIDLNNLIDHLDRSVKMVNDYESQLSYNNANDQKTIQYFENITTLQKIIEKTLFDLKDSKIIEVNSVEYKKLEKQNLELNNLIEKVHDKISPINLLPDETLLFTLLNSVDSFADFEKICRVNHKWNQLAHQPEIINKLCQQRIIRIDVHKIVDFICNYGTNIESLEFYYSNIDDNDLKKLSDACKNLTSLSLKDAKNITDKGLSYLKNMPLKSLTIFSNSITDAGLVSLKELPITDLTLSQTHITDNGLAHLAEMPLTRLSLSGNTNINGSGLIFFKNMPLLKQLDLSFCKITDENLAHLKGVPLTALNLCHCKITDAGLANLAGVPLTALDLNNCKITDAGLAHLVGIPLTELNLLNCNQISDAGLAHLVGMPITKLNLLECRKISDEGLIHLNGMPLKVLNLAFCSRITNKGLVNLKGMLLTNLDLHACDKISDDGLSHLKEMPLEVLSLANCYLITNKGLDHLKEAPLVELNLAKCPKISRLDLSSFIRKGLKIRFNI